MWIVDAEEEDTQNKLFRAQSNEILHSTCTSSIYASTYAQITAEFDISRIVATLGLSLYVVGLGLGPLFLSPLSEVRSMSLHCQSSPRLIGFAGSISVTLGIFERG